jgi:hypothetical protein
MSTLWPVVSTSGLIVLEIISSIDKVEGVDSGIPGSGLGEDTAADVAVRVVGDVVVRVVTIGDAG